MSHLFSQPGDVVPGSVVPPDGVVPAIELLLSFFIQWQQSSFPEAVAPQIPFSEVTLMSNLVESESKLANWLVSTQLPRPPNLLQIS